MAVISSWVAAEVGIIDEGLKVVGQDASAYNLFLGSIPFCFYNIFCLILMFAVTTTGREFGPMLKAERRARKGQPVNHAQDEQETSIMDMEAFQAKEGIKTNIFTALVPIVLMIVLSSLPRLLQVELQSSWGSESTALPFVRAWMSF